MICLWKTKAVNCDCASLIVRLISSTSDSLLRKKLLNLEPKVLNLAARIWVSGVLGLSNKLVFANSNLQLSSYTTLWLQPRI